MCTRLQIMLLAVVLLAFPPPLSAQHVVPYDALNGGGGVLYGSHQVYCTVGQAVAQSTVSGATYQCQPGFWYLAVLESTVEVAITAFTCEYEGDAVHLWWSVSASAGLEGTRIYRAEGEEDEFLELTPELIPAGINTYVDADVLPGRIYSYYICALDIEGSYQSQTVMVSLPPKPLTLYQNYPNPFNPSTTISFFLPEQGRVTLTIFDVQGKRVRTLVDETRDAGRQLVLWDGRNDAGNTVGSGIYYCRLVADKKVHTKKLVILR